MIMISNRRFHWPVSAITTLDYDHLSHEMKSTTCSFCFHEMKTFSFHAIKSGSKLSLHLCIITHPLYLKKRENECGSMAGRCIGYSNSISSDLYLEFLSVGLRKNSLSLRWQTYTFVSICCSSRRVDYQLPLAESLGSVDLVFPFFF